MTGLGKTLSMRPSGRDVYVSRSHPSLFRILEGFFFFLFFIFWAFDEVFFVEQ